MELPLVEPAVVPEVHVDGIASVDRIGDSLKIAYYSIQRSHVSGALEKVVCLRMDVGVSMSHHIDVEWSRARAVTEVEAESLHH